MREQEDDKPRRGMNWLRGEVERMRKEAAEVVSVFTGLRVFLGMTTPACISYLIFVSCSDKPDNPGRTISNHLDRIHFTIRNARVGSRNYIAGRWETKACYGKGSKTTAAKETTNLI